jgi:hypothetical protein
MNPHERRNYYRFALTAKRTASQWFSPCFRAGRAPHGVCGNAANFSRSLATARKTVIGVFLPEVNSGKRRKLLYALRAYIEFSENDSFRQ